MNHSTINGWETPHTITVDNTFHSDDEAGTLELSSERNLSFGRPTQTNLSAAQSIPASQDEEEVGYGFVLSKKSRSAAACQRSLGQMILPAKDIPDPSKKDRNCKNIQTIHIHPNKLITLSITFQIVQAIPGVYVPFHKIHSI